MVYPLSIGEGAEEEAEDDQISGGNRGQGSNPRALISSWGVMIPLVAMKLPAGPTGPSGAHRAAGLHEGSVPAS